MSANDLNRIYLTNVEKLLRRVKKKAAKNQIKNTCKLLAHKLYFKLLIKKKKLLILFLFCFFVAPMLIEVENGDQHLYFKLSSNLQNSQIQSAHLWIFLRPTRHTLHRNVTLYQVDRQFEFGELDFLQVTQFYPFVKLVNS